VLSTEPHRILLIRLRAFGDVVLTTPLLRALKLRYPFADLHVLTDSLPGALLSGNPHVNRSWVSPPRNAPLGEQIGFLRRLCREKFDLVLGLFGNPRSAWMAFATGAPVRAGYAYRFRRHAYTHPVPMNKVRKYQVEVNLDVLRHLGIPDDGGRTELFLRDAERHWAGDYLRKHLAPHSESLVGLNPTGSWSAKRWPFEHWTTLVERLAGKGLRPLVFWSPGDPEGVKAWADERGNKVVLAPPTDMRQLMALISELGLLVGNDGAPQHIAQALGVKTLTLFGPTWGISWNPPSDERFRFLQTFPPCGPCDKTLCPYLAAPDPDGRYHQECLAGLKPDVVWAEAERMLSGI
jgi:ADP-heptose:LPS heptosyltransferase